MKITNETPLEVQLHRCSRCEAFATGLADEEGWYCWSCVGHFEYEAESYYDSLREEGKI
jgi:predicted amidophosphoribosyltransferase